MSFAEKEKEKKNYPSPHGTLTQGARPHRTGWELG